MLVILGLLLAGSALAEEPPKRKPSKFSKAPIDITTDAYGAFSDAPDAPGVGDVIPDFSLPRTDGKTFKLSRALKDREALLIFYRGHW